MSLAPRGEKPTRRGWLLALTGVLVLAGASCVVAALSPGSLLAARPGTAAGTPGTASAIPSKAVMDGMARVAGQNIPPRTVSVSPSRVNLRFVHPHGKPAPKASPSMPGTPGPAPTTEAPVVRPSASSSPSVSPSPNAQEQDLENRVGNTTHFTGCDIPAQPVAGAVATVNCQARQSGITVTAASFNVTGTAIPFVTSLISGESAGLNTFLGSTIPNSLPVVPGSNAPVCGPSSGSTCPTVGYSGYWGSPSLIIGRIYCYEGPGSDYFIVWTFDNDEYEAEHNEDFAVVASSSNLAALVSWWNQTPV